ncbi:Alpha/Beta hydrolase protein [Fusarium oxysporum f. sp. albedinis]|nr:Alpha/Beta hydrolase protein [Fusarium oxysporum f. sp. albedinis]
MDESPDLVLIQAGPLGSWSLPLFLIHDDNGDISRYFLLNSLGRNVYGIRNRCCESAKAWPGGVPEMAKAYLDLVRAVQPSGKILLGGWSLGGLISLEVALVLARHEPSPLRVQGIVMIDTVFPTHQPSIRQIPNLRSSEFKVGEIASKRPISTHPCTAHSQIMMAAWRPLPWPVRYIYEAPVDGEKESSISRRKTRRSSAIRYRQPPPPAILLRAQQRIPVVLGCNNMGYCLDMYRHDDMLGWENYEEDFITSVVDIEGHHFSVFDQSHH